MKMFNRAFGSLIFFIIALSLHVTSFVTRGFFGSKMSLPLPVRQVQRVSNRLYGIPKLFRWLLDLYPHSIDEENGSLWRDDSSVDNFYLDMNGIIHTCTHNNDDTMAAQSEQEMMMRIFKYTDQLYKLVRPRNMMYLAIDGVAPRAKMNQQRSRRFRAVKDRELANAGPGPSLGFDSNCITPGTDFMYRLSKAFQLWIRHKMTDDPVWKSGATVIFSGPNVPGEGEHKIMDRIRKDQSQSTQKAKLRHCMYGLDADLIMLSLITREPHFFLLREKLQLNKRLDNDRDIKPSDFDILHVPMLRRLLQLHVQDTIHNFLKIHKTHSFVSEPLEIDRIIDDFVFICFLIGNDFIPTLPHLDIADGAILLLLNTYCGTLCKPGGGYLTEKHKLHLPRIELFIQEISRREPLYFEHRAVEDCDSNYASENYKDYYYMTKFGLLPSDLSGRQKVVERYVESLAWVASYYHRGCVSWNWYYPYLYAPCASDIRNLSSMNITFEEGRPFTPLLQLLSVLPPQSAHFLPHSYEQLTTERSPLSLYFPTDFEVDPNGKRNSWESVVRIPFLEEGLLVNSVNKIDHAFDLSWKEKSRNRIDMDVVFEPAVYDKP